MASALQDSYATLGFSFPVGIGRFIAALVSRRQRQADERVAQYLRDLPDEVMRKLGVSPTDMAKLRRCEPAHPPGNLYGRVSVMSVLRSSRC
jgi:hypothetical protein